MEWEDKSDEEVDRDASPSSPTSRTIRWFPRAALPDLPSSLVSPGSTTPLTRYVLMPLTRQLSSDEVWSHTFDKVNPNSFDKEVKTTFDEVPLFLFLFSFLYSSPQYLWQGNIIQVLWRGTYSFSFLCSSWQSLPTPLTRIIKSPMMRKYKPLTRWTLCLQAFGSILIFSDVNHKYLWQGFLHPLTRISEVIWQ